MSLGTDSFDARFAIRLVVAPPLRASSSKLPDSRSVPCSGGVVRTDPRREHLAVFGAHLAD